MLFDRIALFVAVARHHNLGRTAREMHVSASSICQRLKSLESDFGAKLYKKNKEGIELTGAGQTLLTTASEVLNRLEGLKKSLNPESELTAQFLVIGGSYNPSAKDLPAAIAAFRKTHPDVKVTFLTSDRRSIEKLVRESEVDLAIIQNPSKSSDFNLEHFAVDNLVFFAHPMHPLAKKKSLDLEHLEQTPIIIRDARGGSQRMLKELRCRGFTLNVALRCATPATVKAVVQRKMGVGVLFHNHVKEEVKRKDLKILKFSGLPDVVADSFIVYRKDKPLSSVADEFLTVLRSMKSRPKNTVNLLERSSDSSSR